MTAAQVVIGRIWRRFELRAHFTDGFKLSTDPLFVEKVIDVASLYHNPPERAVVLCVDEKPQVQTLDRSQPVLPSRARCTTPGSRFVPARTITMAGAGLDRDPPICSVSLVSLVPVAETPNRSVWTGFSAFVATSF